MPVTRLPEWLPWNGRQPPDDGLCRMDTVLQTGARLLIWGLRMTLALSSAAAPVRSVLWPRIRALYRADP